MKGMFLNRMLQVGMLFLSVVAVHAQTLYVPGGTATGIGSSPAGNTNVGIGISVPTSKVHISGGDLRWFNSLLKNDQGGAIELGGNDAVAGGYPYIDFHGGTAIQDYSARIYSTTNNQFIIATASGGNVLAVQDGYVGIGTTAPASALHMKGGQLLVDNGYISVYGNQYGIQFSGVVNNATSANNDKFYFSPSGTGTSSLLSLYRWDGTTTYTPLVIDAVGNVRLVPYAGKVGIGTTTPNASLDVRSPNNTLQLRLSPVGGTGTVSIPSSLDMWSTFAGITDQSPRRTATIKSFYDGGTWGNEALAFEVGTGGVNDAGAEPTERMRIMGNGYVGIGITIPQATLNIVGNEFLNPVMVRVGRSGPGPGAQYIEFGQDKIASGPDHFVLRAIGSVPATFSISAEQSTKYINFLTGGVERMFMLSTGEIGIGQQADFVKGFPTGYSLYVENGILAEKFKCAIKSTINWSDHVFANEYKLASIAEMESFIKANKHLPGVPSAEQMVENGLDVASMDAKLLEKIEELSLYVIELKKENEKILKKVEALEKGNK